MSREIVVVDIETNGLDLERHQAVEVAWWNLTTRERGYFIPSHDIRQVLYDADVMALRVNRYIDRIPSAPYDPKWAEKLEHLVGNLMGPDGVGATLAGSNPSFDAAMLNKLIGRVMDDENLHRGMEFETSPWHHRMWDLSAYAAGVLGLDELPGLAKVCELLDVTPGDHTAEADVTATGLCFYELQARAKR